MKKYLPFIFLGIGVLVLVSAFFVVKSRKVADTPSDDEEVALVDVPIEKRPVAQLTPRSDGHWLDLKIEKLMVEGAESLDYELLYNLPDGRIQGVPGTVMLSGKDAFEAELLLGSESSGKFRYDEGVDGGTLTLRFRNAKGKLLAKFSTEFTMSLGGKGLKSSDTKFTFNAGEDTASQYFVVMETFGYPEGLDGKVVAGPYGVFASDEDLAGSIDLEGKIMQWDGSNWTSVDKGSAALGIFVVVE